jgi:hypothetical protein
MACGASADTEMQEVNFTIRLPATQVIQASHQHINVQYQSIRYKLNILNCANDTYLLDVWVISILLINIHLITTLTNIFTFAKVIYESQTFSGLTF